ncbi:hypothetical protein O7622_06870 [Micromonospora sp. WMMD1076]|uniref:hypothetical protein n=1 Tax=Micromonospora sp. WMMD1076 TaxID=3016103 RepID=UPI00249B1C78|nr:hypothetical protein [Micromonospora sp. WMMD1076]WFF08279.1 hypothetical protein O7622_06870 [Micromonospora sp. WMMD1076]
MWELYGDFLVQSQKLGINAPQGVVFHKECQSCDPYRLAEFYTLPVAVLVENPHTDGRWLQLIVNKLRPRLARYLNGPGKAVDLRHGGGIGSVPAELRRLAEEYRRYHPGEAVPLRVVVIVDSDRESPDHISGSANQVMRVASELGATCHVLAKRSIENYIPDDALDTFVQQRADRRYAVEVIKSLSAPARDFYPMKAGLTADLHSRSGSLYPDDIPLGVGLGDFMADFLDNFSHSLSGQGLRERDRVLEFEELLDKLEKNL